MSDPIKPDKIVIPPATISLPHGFVFGEVLAQPRKIGVPPTPQAPLGPLAAFVGSWTGSGFNTIFRPNLGSPTKLPKIAHGPNDNILQLNLTSESLTFSPSLGSVPNRGEVQPDIFLNGVPYLQAVNDVTDPTIPPVGIHVEPGLWICVPSTTNPTEVQTIVRMGSIPHGTVFQAQGTSTTMAGPPTIPPVSITPFTTNNNDQATPTNSIRFPSQTASDNATFRIPQDLSTIPITQNMLDDPNTVIRNHISGQNIVSTTQISINTLPSPSLINPIQNMPKFGGGTVNIAFLDGNAPSNNPPSNPAINPNAQTLQMAATFWIETVQHTIVVPIFKPGQPPLMIKGEAKIPGQIVPTFHVNPPIGVTVPRKITFTSMQIQYSQVVFLNFNGLTWPHVSVATLVPAGPIPIPPSAWA